MNILCVHNSADLYGASRSLIRLCLYVQKQEHTPSVLLPESGPLVHILKEIGVVVYIDPGLKVITRSTFKSFRILPWLISFPFSVLKLRIFLRNHPFSVVHTNTGVICSSALAAKLAGVKHVWHIRDWFQEFGALWKPYAKYILACSDAVICVSGPIKDQFPPSPKITVIHNGFDLEDYPPISDSEKNASKQKFHIPDDAFVIGCVGRIKFHRKGQEFVLHAARILHDNHIPVYVVLAGGNPPGASDQMDKMKKLASKLHLDAYVRFTGELSDIRPVYAALNVLVLPSAQPEPFGGVVMEGMCYSLPVIGTTLGGTVEQIEDGVTGYLVEAARPELIAEKCTQLYQDPQRAVNMGRHGRLRIKEKFYSSELHKKITTLFQDVSGDESL